MPKSITANQTSQMTELIHLQIIDITDVIQDETCQARIVVKPDADAVANLERAYKNRESVEPVYVFQEGKSYWLADGFHRMAALKKVKAKKIRAHVAQGTILDARLYAATANIKNGKEATLADRKKAVRLVLDTLKDKGEEWSETKIGQHCGVVQATVAGIRAERGERELPPSVKKQREGQKALIISAQNPDSEPSGHIPGEYDADATLDENAESGWVSADDDDVQAPERFPDTPGQRAVKDDDAKRKAEKASPVDADSHMPADPPKPKNGREVYNAREMKKAYAAWGVVNRALHAIGRASELETERNAIEAAFREAQEGA